MTKTWVYSDPHFHHQNICRFTTKDGSPLRPWDDAEKMTEEMVAMYNDLVDDRDRVYILGDVAFHPRYFHTTVARLKGRKVLVPGNHEPPKMRKYFDVFDDVRGYVVKKDFIMSHIPIHEESLSRWKLNIHGHTHSNEVMLNGKPDERYYCVCVEKTGFKPKLLDEILTERGLKNTS